MAENGRKRRGRVPVAEKVADLDAKIEAAKIRVHELETRRARLIADARQRHQAALAELPDA